MKRTATKSIMLLHEPPNVSLNNNLINDQCTESEKLQREVSYLESIEDLSKMELTMAKLKTNGHTSRR